MADSAAICRRHGPASRQQDGAPMLPSHLNAMADRDPCRTAARGGTLADGAPGQEPPDRSRAGTKRPGPPWQQDQAQAWRHTHQAWRLPVPHLMVTFPLPDDLRRLARSPQPSRPQIRFGRSAAALQARAAKPSVVGGTRGMGGGLHPAPRELHYPPPVHDLVPGGGLSTDGPDWVPSRADCLVHVKPRARRFRATCRAP